MAASIDITGMETFTRSLNRAVSGELQQAMVRSLQTAGPKMVADMNGAAFTKIQKRAVGTVTLRQTSDGITISGGGGGSLGGVLFDGAEYGGRKPQKVTYATRSRLGKPYIVSRRTTMQFLPHLGEHGYFFWPTVRDWMKKLTDEHDKILQKALGAR